MYFDGFEPDRYHTWSMRYDATTRTLEGYIDGQMVGKFEYLILNDVTPTLFYHTGHDPGDRAQAPDHLR